MINGDPYDVDPETVMARVSARSPEPVRTHWVEISGRHYPVKQALEAALGLSRLTFTSQTAGRLFDRLGFKTSMATPGIISSTNRKRPQGHASIVSVADAGVAFATLVAFLRTEPLTANISQLEHRLVGSDRTTAGAQTQAAGLTEDLLKAALVVRRDVGRVSDVIHATVISLALPAILEEGEFVTKRPSLGPGNDPNRQFDLETNRRVAEFKVAVWSGGDVMRQRTLAADLVHLALDDSGLRPELWAAGTQPLDFLRTSASPMLGLLSRSSHHLRKKYEDRYGTENIAVRDFVREHAADVQLLNLGDVLPDVAAALI